MINAMLEHKIETTNSSSGWGWSDITIRRLGSEYDGTTLFLTVLTVGNCLFIIKVTNSQQEDHSLPNTFFDRPQKRIAFFPPLIFFLYVRGSSASEQVILYLQLFNYVFQHFKIRHAAPSLFCVFSTGQHSSHT